MDVCFGDLAEDARHRLLHGDAGFEGVLPFLAGLVGDKYKAYVRFYLRRYQKLVDCPACRGSRLRAEALHVKVGGASIAELSSLSVSRLRRFLSALPLGEFERGVARLLLDELDARLEVLEWVGVGYLSLDRPTKTLSAGEAQRISLANALGGAALGDAERAIVAMGRQQWSEATTLAEQALAMLQSGRLNDYFMSPLVHTVAARTALHRGDLPRAKEHLVQAARRRPLLTYAIPSVAVQTLLELGRAYLALDDAAGARTVLRQARGILQLRPDLGVLPDQAEELQAKLDLLRGGVPGVSTLTTAELRLLPLLATHLNFLEIGQRLYISKHTAKSQAASIYRKLGASSRSEAVQRLQEIGLLEE